MGSFVLCQGFWTVDFAYEIPYQDREKATGAKVNGRMVPLTTKLKAGDGLEIIAIKFIWTKS